MADTPNAAAGPARGLVVGFLTQVLERPGAPALSWRDGRISYGELHQAARREGERPARLGLPPGEPVGILADKSPGAVALILGCLLTGRPFLLPSPALPDNLLSDLFAQAGCRAVLAPSGTAERVLPRSGVPAQPAPEGTSFLLTTSGSTGLPKVVPLPDAGVDGFVAWAAGAFGVRPGTVVLNYAPLNFDLCLFDVWAGLAAGAEVVLVEPDRAVDGRHLLEVLARHRVEIVQAVPMMFGVLRDAAARSGATLPAVRHALFTGDVLHREVLAELPGLFPNAALHNVYGCTETNDSFVFDLPPAADGVPQTPVPIGRPLPGVAALLAGPEGVVEGPGAGELYVSTPFQSTGYLDRTRHREKFTRHPLGSDDRIWFRTGDLVRRDAEGLFHLTGRADHQVKVRGVAVNTAEIEQVLLAHPDVVEAGVTALPDPLTGNRLVAAVRSRPHAALNSLALKGHCARGLPRAAVPSVLRVLDRPLPRTSTGKVDRRALDRLTEPSIEGSRQS